MRKPRPTGMLPQLKRYCIVVAGICSEPSFDTKVHGTQQATQKTQHQNQRALKACGSANASSSRSEHELQSELHVARISARAGDLAEPSSIDETLRIGKVRMIRQIEELPAEFQMFCFGDAKVLEQ